MNIDKNTKIGVVGFGVEGFTLTNYLRKHGYSNIAVYDERDEARGNLGELRGQDRALGILTFFGKDSFQKMTDREVLFRSPGIHPDKLQKFRKLGIHSTSSTQYFMEHCPCPVIGVTGTKGKGTTSTLIYLMLKEAGHDVYLGGNIGESPLNFLDALTPESKVVLELSSFQLQDLTISPHIAVVLNVTSDHLDYHKDVKEYRQAKIPITKFQQPGDVIICNDLYYSSDFLEASPNSSKIKKILVNTEDPVEEGAYLDDGKIVLKMNGTTTIIAETEKVALFGFHHFENILPAVCVAALNGVKPEQMRKILASFKGLPHRLQLVAEIDGVQYYDDSIATTPETSLAATRAFEKPIILIAGGSEKNANYGQWAAELQRNALVRMVILIGATAEKMAKALKSTEILPLSHLIPPLHGSRENPLKVIQCKTLKGAVDQARKNAVAGLVVLLSPAAASFGMFQNYKERGEKFQKLLKPVQNLHIRPQN